MRVPVVQEGAEAVAELVEAGAGRRQAAEQPAARLLFAGGHEPGRRRQDAAVQQVEDEAKQLLRRMGLGAAAGITGPQRLEVQTLAQGVEPAGGVVGRQVGIEGEPVRMVAGPGEGRKGERAWGLTTVALAASIAKTSWECVPTSRGCHTQRRGTLRRSVCQIFTARKAGRSRQNAATGTWPRLPEYRC